jgi:hypothetical protein
MRTVLAALVLLFAALPARAAFEQILKLGDPAPAIGTAGYTIASYVEPPSMVAGDFEPYVVFHVTIAGPGVTAANSHVIYRWSPSTDVQRVARGGDLVIFPDGSSRLLTQLETPIADDFGWVAFTSQLDDFTRGLVVWNALSEARIGVARVGLGVVLQCESVSGAPCGPAPGTLTSIATFNDRRGAAFASYVGLLGDVEHRVVFRAPVNAPGFGAPDALWMRTMVEPTGASSLVNLANSLQKADGAGSTTYFDDFTDVVLCDSRDAVGLATVSRDAPYAVYYFAPGGDGHTLLKRGYAPDATPRRDLHCLGSYVGYVGGYTPVVDPGLYNKGAFLLDIDTMVQNQLYLYGLSVPPDPLGETLGAPVGAAVALDVQVSGLPAMVYAAKLLTFFTGNDVLVFDLDGSAPAYTIAWEGDTDEEVQTMWSAAVNSRGNVALHLRRPDTTQEIRVFDPRGNTIASVGAGDPIELAPGDTRPITTFWLLGGTFGNDVAVTGSGRDGQVGALTDSGLLAALVFYGPGSGGQPPGVAVATAPVVPEGFADGFEDVAP